MSSKNLPFVVNSLTVVRCFLFSNATFRIQSFNIKGLSERILLTGFFLRSTIYRILLRCIHPCKIHGNNDFSADTHWDEFITERAFAGQNLNRKN